MPPSPILLLLTVIILGPTLGCLTPPPRPGGGLAQAIQCSDRATPPAPEKLTEIEAWAAVPRLTPAINIGNTLENTTSWETGWGNPLITKDYIDTLARQGWKSIRLPVAWDTYAEDGRVSPEKFSRVAEVVDWITSAGLFCVVKIHCDGGWIDSGNQEKFPQTFATFSPEAEKKFRSYWEQIATFFAGKNEKLIFEGLNEETNFSRVGSQAMAYATLTRVNQLFIDTVRKTGGHNAKRLLIITGYHTDIEKTCAKEYQLPKDTLPGRLLLSVHYYTPWPFCGMTEDADWGKMMKTWGTPDDLKQLNTLFDKLKDFSIRNDVPIYLGEYGVSHQKDPDSRARFFTAVTNAAITRKMVPVLWDTGHDSSRHSPYALSPELQAMLKNLAPFPRE